MSIEYELVACCFISSNILSRELGGFTFCYSTLSVIRHSATVFAFLLPTSCIVVKPSRVLFGFSYHAENCTTQRIAISAEPIQRERALISSSLPRSDVRASPQLLPSELNSWVTRNTEQIGLRVAVFEVKLTKWNANSDHNH